MDPHLCIHDKIGGVGKSDRRGYEAVIAVVGREGEGMRAPLQLEPSNRASVSSIALVCWGSSKLLESSS